jgi:hypothetical protein
MLRRGGRTVADRAFPCERGLKMSYRPTSHLRLVRTERESILAGLDVILGGHTPPRLQQLWTSSYVGEEDQWRDVPLAILPDAAHGEQEKK